MKRSVLAIALMATAFALATLAALSGNSEIIAAPTCNCPDVFAPVICDNGKGYENICYARCDHAKHCVPAEP